MKISLIFPFLLCDLALNMLKLTNIYRRMHNLKELKAIEPLKYASQLQANSMCREMKITHLNKMPKKRTLRDRLDYYKFKGINIGENIAKQQNSDFKEVFKVWIKSDMHKKNILGDYDYTGVGTCVGKDKNRYWVQVFGKGYVNNERNKHNKFSEQYPKDQSSRRNTRNKQKSRNNVFNPQDMDNSSDTVIPSDEGIPEYNEVDPYKMDSPLDEEKDDETPDTFKMSDSDPYKPPLEEYENPDASTDKRDSEPLPLESLPFFDRNPRNNKERRKRPRKSFTPNEAYKNTKPPDEKKPQSQFSKQDNNIKSTDESGEPAEFLLKEDEDIGKIENKLPRDAYLEYKGKYKKFIIKRKNISKEPEKLETLSIPPKSQEARTLTSISIIPSTIMTKSSEHSPISTFKDSTVTVTPPTVTVTSSKLLPSNSKISGELSSLALDNSKKHEKFEDFLTNSLPNKLEDVLSTVLSKLAEIERQSKKENKIKATTTVTKPIETQITTKPIESQITTKPIESQITTKPIESQTTIVEEQKPSISSTISKLKTITSTVIKTIYESETSNPIESATTLQTTLTVTYIKAKSDASASDKSMTMTVNLSRPNPMTNESSDSNIKKLISSLVKKSKIKDNDEEEKDLTNYITNLVEDIKKDCKSVDIGDPLSLKT